MHKRRAQYIRQRVQYPTQLLITKSQHAQAADDVTAAAACDRVKDAEACKCSL